MYKSIVLPILEYCCVVWNPNKLYLIRKIECIQRDFTRRFRSLDGMDYWERLKKLRIFSLERRRERYIILYVFKILYGLVPNPGIYWFSLPRQGRLIQAPTVRSRSAFGFSLKHNSFHCISARLFNCLPYDLRNMTCSMNTVKSHLDNFLRKVPDQPRLLNYSERSLSISNSICDQITFATDE